MSHDRMSDRTAVILAREECRGNALAVEVCDMFLRMLDEKPIVSRVEQSLPRESE